MNMNNYYTARKNIFQGIRESSTVAKILMSFLMACFTGLMAQIIIDSCANNCTNICSVMLRINTR